ncbi:MAG: PAS domain S-box protein [Kiritimatiellales bacterium]
MNSAPVQETPCRILLADDHDTYRKTIISLLGRRGYQVTSASCGEEVLAAAVEQPFDLFVLDYKMPGNEELILVEQLKVLQPDVPVIILTGFASLPSAMNAVRLQLFDYIQKDETPDHLLARIDDAIKQARLENKLRESESRYRLLAENIQDVITVFSTTGKAVYASPSIKTVFGYTPEECGGTNLYELIHPEDRNGLESTMVQLTENGQVNDYEARFQTRSGQYIWLSTSAKLLKNAAGAPQELVCSSRDITERKQAEEILKASEVRYQMLAQHLEAVREEERKRLSRELHDDIGQILTALKIDLAILNDHCSCSHGIKQKMEGMQRLLSEGIQNAHLLCRRLRPGALDDLCLEDALFGLMDDWKQRNAVEYTLCVDIEDEMLSDAVRTAVFRMVQEALTNVSRYAGASNVEIHLVSDGQVFTVSVSDNGSGMEEGAEDKSTSFGLLGMRERIEALGGTLHIESAPGKGTRIEGVIPLKNQIWQPAQ